MPLHIEIIAEEKHGILEARARCRYAEPLTDREDEFSKAVSTALTKILQETKGADKGTTNIQLIERDR